MIGFDKCSICKDQLHGWDNVRPITRLSDLGGPLWHLRCDPVYIKSLEKEAWQKEDREKEHWLIRLVRKIIG